MREGGPVSVRDFMAAAIRAYYARGPDIGAKGDFYTASNVSLFAPAIARFVAAARERLPDARLVELGGGTGRLASVLGADVVVEPNAGLAETQRARGLRVVASLTDLEPAATVFVANEVLDALPAHRLRVTDEGVREVYVEWQDGKPRETLQPIGSPRLADLAWTHAAQLPVGCAFEMCIDAERLLAEMAYAAPRCLALFLDYGGSFDELYGMQRPEGTLRGYAGHRTTGPYERPGEQDVTVDVDFTLVQKLAEPFGYVPMGMRPQSTFLMDLGLVDDMMRAQASGDMDAYFAAKNLLMPSGMGERFKVLCLGRGVAASPPLPGFRPATTTW